MLNRIVLIGRLTKDPESQYTPNGIAVDRPTKNPEAGERETDFIDVVAWRRTAEFVTQYMTKGRLVAVDGRLQIRSWIAQDGSKRYATEVVADNVEGLDRPREGEAGAGMTPSAESAREYAPPSTSAEAPAAAKTTRTAAPPPEDDLDEIDPFADE